MAMSKFVGGGKVGDYTYERTLAGRTVRAKAGVPIDSTVLEGFPAQGAPVKLRNTSDRTLFATLLVRGVPKAGEEKASSSGLSIDVSYEDAEGAPVDLARVVQGGDIVAQVSVRNLTPHRIDNIALTQMVPAGYEIHNERMEGAESAGARSAEPRRTGFFFIPDGSPSATSGTVEHLDIRDDRVLRYFGLKPGESIGFKTRLNAAYLGRFYLPSLSVEAMYDATKAARTRGQWVEVVSAR
jgi:uncharacterized protein YfaS (alpha-2-macroglobulin family)